MFKIKINKYLFNSTTILLLLLFFVPNLVLAEVTRVKLSGVEVSNDFVVGPGKTELSANPGQTVIKNISITNRVNNDVSFTLSIEDFIGSDDPNQSVVLLGDTQSPYSLKDFIKPEITSFTLAFGERITIPVHITIPADSEPRGYYGAVLVSNLPEEDIDPETGQPVATGKTRLISRVGSLFLLRVNGKTLESGSLSSFNLLEPAKTIYSQKPNGFEALFKNDGNVHLVPYGEISITNVLGKEVDRLPIDAYFVLPDSTRARQINWNNDFFGIGRYKANLSLYKGYGNEADLELKSIVFWIFPWKIVLIVFISLVLLITLIYYLVSRFEIKRKN